QAYRDLVHREHLGQFWGALLVIDGGEVVFSGGFGFQDAESLRRIDDQSLFDIGSIAKPITAIAILQLIEQGKVTLDTTVDEIFGEASTTPLTRAITIRHLLTHTSGLNDRAALQQLSFADRDQAVRRALTSAPLAGAGERWAYCNAGYVLLAAAVERLTDEDFEHYVRTNIFEPAGMDGTGFLSGDGLDDEHFTTRELLMQGVPSRRAMLEDGWGWGLRGAGGVLTSAHALTAFHHALTTPGVLLSAESLDLMDTIAWNTGQPMALGWFADAAKDGTMRRRHGGGTRGYMAELRRYPDRDAMIVVMTNMRWRPDALADALEAKLLGIEPARARAEIDHQQLTLNEYKLATIDGPSLRVEPDGEGGAVMIAGTNGIDALRLTMNSSAARSASRTLGNMLGGTARNSMPRTELNLGMMPYSLEDSTLVISGEAVSLTIMPDYNGQLGPTLVLQDAANGFWPVLMRLSNADARLLADGLARCLE
ncbi:MAG: serine hydrolase domain-containing protein, partial [Phycisphaerales bacterium JB064]